MRVLLIVIQFPPDTNSTGQLMSQLCEGLARCGHDITVLTTFPHYEHFRIGEEHRGKWIERTREQGLEIIRLFTYAPGKKTMFNRLLSYVTFNTLAAITATLSRSRWDVILCPNGSFFTGLAASFIGVIKSVPFIYNVQDLYPDVPVRAGQLRNPYAIEALKAIEKLMYRQAAHVTVISPMMRDNLVSKGVAPEKISMIPNFVDTDFIRPLPKVNDFAKEHGLVDKFVVTHAGNLGYVYDLETLLDAASLLSSEKNISFLIVGNGVAKAKLEKKARDLKLANLRFMPLQPHERLPWLRACSDVQVSLYKNGAAQDSFPSKIYEIMASGRPLLASAEGGSGVQALVAAAQCGLCVRPGDAEQLAAAILSLYHNRSMGETMGGCGRQYAESNHSKETVVARYNELFQRVSELSPSR